MAAAVDDRAEQTWTDAGVLLYGEQHLVRAPTPDDAPRPGLVTALIEAGSAQQREALVRCALHDIGFDWMAYGTVVPQRGGNAPVTFLTTYAHKPWSRHYFAERFYEIDPRQLQAPRSNLPLVWDIDRIDTPAPDAPVRLRHFMDDFRDSGVGSGVFFHLPSPQRVGERTVISLMARSADCRWIDDQVLGRALTLGLCAHEFFSRHMRLQCAPTDVPTLSPAQQEILRCLVRGHSDKEIALRLHLSAHTVDYHLRQLRRRFAARNRVQLVSAAMAVDCG